MTSHEWERVHRSDNQSGAPNLYKCVHCWARVFMLPEDTSEFFRPIEYGYAEALGDCDEEQVYEMLQE